MTSADTDGGLDTSPPSGGWTWDVYLDGDKPHTAPAPAYNFTSHVAQSRGTTRNPSRVIHYVVHTCPLQGPRAQPVVVAHMHTCVLIGLWGCYSLLGCKASRSMAGRVVYIESSETSNLSTSERPSRPVRRACST